jgi:plastocyanin
MNAPSSPSSSRQRPRRAARSVAITVLLAGVTLGALACASSEAALDPNNLPGTGTTVQVRSSDNVFAPETLEVRAGTEVVWTNVGRNVHDIVPAKGDAWGIDQNGFGKGAEYRHVFTEPGEYGYYCSLHGTARAGMVGKVVVTR